MAILQGFLCLCLAPGAVDTSFQIDGRAVRFDPAAVFDGDDIFVPLDDFSRSVNLEAKTVVAGKLVVLCRGDKCQPVHLKTTDFRTVGGVPLVNLRTLALATGRRVSITRSDNRRIIMVAKKKSPEDKGQSGELTPGTMLPDVKLTDLAGKAVHLSDYLGKRLLICTWASW